jgi:hypothetical protein
MLVKTISEFRENIDGIYGTFLDACEGFSRVRLYMGQLEEESIRSHEELKEKRPEFAHVPFGGVEFSYGRIEPAGRQRLRHLNLHQVPIETIKARNSAGGENFRLIGHVCLVTLFQYWEDRYRLSIAQALTVEKNQIQVPLFGDIRRYRQAIIHNHGQATAKLENCSVLRWFTRGERIVLSRDMFEEIIDGVLAALEGFRSNPEQYIKRA